MRFIVSAAGREHVVDLRGGDGGKWQAELDGHVHHLDARCLPGGVVNLVVDGRIHDVEVERVPVDPEGRDGHVRLRLHGREWVVQVVEEQRMQLQRAAIRAPQAPGSLVVVSPMPGRVVKILRDVGSTVQCGDGLVVVEAMKMENMVRAAAPGRVVEVRVQEGQAVDGGMALVMLQAEPMPGDGA